MLVAVEGGAPLQGCHILFTWPRRHGCLGSGSKLCSGGPSLSCEQREDRLVSRLSMAPFRPSFGRGDARTWGVGGNGGRWKQRIGGRGGGEEYS